MGTVLESIAELVELDRQVDFCEGEGLRQRWLTSGQRRAYLAVVKSGHMSALLKHSVPLTRKIKTRTDVESFQVMYLAASGKPDITDVIEGSLWPLFVDEWYRDPYLRLELHRPSYLKTVSARRRNQRVINHGEGR